MNIKGTDWKIGGYDDSSPGVAAEVIAQLQHELNELAVDGKKRPVRYAQKVLANGTKVPVATPRVGDDEREWVARRLDEMWARGFLSQREHEERHKAAFAAITRGELNKTLIGLPEDPEEWRQVRKVLAKEPDVIQPKAKRASPLMLGFALLTLMTGIAAVSAPAGPIAANLAGFGLIIVSVVTILREAARP